jgi:hypothetical protein
MSIFAESAQSSNGALYDGKADIGAGDPVFAALAKIWMLLSVASRSWDCTLGGSISSLDIGGLSDVGFAGSMTRAFIAKAAAPRRCRSPL